MTTKDLCRAIDAISARIDENRDALVSLDQQNGDGDLGISMSGGFRAVSDFLHDSQETDLGKCLNRCGDHFNGNAMYRLGDPVFDSFLRLYVVSHCVWRCLCARR